jgi:hypothetical protein
LPVGDPGILAGPGPHIMTNTALDGATYDIDGGEQLVPAT